MSFLNKASLEHKKLYNGEHRLKRFSPRVFFRKRIPTLHGVLRDLSTHGVASVTGLVKERPRRKKRDL